jgi:aldehyde:ferredoxin oxidoreductase
METPRGYISKLLQVNLTEQELETTSLNPEWARLYIGGTGYATRILYE